MTKDETNDQSGAVPEQPIDEAAGSSESIEVAQTENPAQPGLELPDNAINLVPYLLEVADADPKVKKFIEDELPSQVIRHFNEDWESRSKWMQKRKERIALFLGDIKDKTEPFKNCANMHVPILMTRILRLVSRVWTEFHKNGQPLFSARAGSKMTEEQADIITKHENWQFSKEIPDFPSHTWRALVEFIRDGDCIFDSYRDFVHNVNRHEYVSPDEFVYPYVRRTTAPDMSDVPRKTKILFPYKRDLLEMQDMGFYAQVDKVTKTPGSHEMAEVDEVVRDAVDAFEGKDRKEHTQDAPYWLLEQHTWVKLPYQEKEEPYRVVVDGKTRTVLGLYSRYYEDPEDSVRCQRESQEYQAYLAAAEQYAEVMQKEQELLTVIQQPHVPQDQAQAIAQQVQVERPAPPMKPAWMTFDAEGKPNPPAPCKKKIIERFSHATCIDNPEGSMGIGVGTLLMPHQMAANILMNQFIDAGTLANSNTVVVHDTLKFPTGMTTINPNEITKVRGVPPDQIEKAIFRFDHQPANTQLLTGVQQQEAAADSISSAPDVLSGEKEGDETFRGAALRVEQATKQLSAIAAKFMVAANQVAKNNALLNSMFLPDTRTVDARDPATGQLSMINVTRDMYRDSYDIIFSADLSFASRATKVAEADDAMGLLLKGLPPPLLTLVVKPEGIAAAVRKCLQTRGLYDLAAYVNSDQEVAAKIAQQMQQAAMQPPGAPPGGPAPAPHPGPPAPAIPDGQPQHTPGAGQSPDSRPAPPPPNVQ